MNFKEQTASLRKLVGGAVNLALIPVRLPGALIRYLADEFTRYEQRQVWRRHVQGTYLDPETREPWWTRIGKGIVPDPREYH